MRVLRPLYPIDSQNAQKRLINSDFVSCKISEIVAVVGTQDSLRSQKET
jgi:hypothetical protein